MFKLFLSLIVLIALASSFTFRLTKSTADLEFPENVKAIIDDKCYGCHSDKGKSDKAKEKLMWDELSGLSKIKLISTLVDISEVTEKMEMPPEKFLNDHPEKKLTEEEASILYEWANSSAQKVLE